ncbi:hypothetical protein [Kitasatospora sp. GP82]|uniref:hypothetical protein n=1 Tax=Kitasatospora sp. GP82 TaxID=3035089 RepID=UPI002475DA1E|nr:hypothetical protein [Kitasatospora sp. GP82]MDH6128271.1 hypothetical protein [Kitasatospora sp. GP82]
MLLDRTPSGIAASAADEIRHLNECTQQTAAYPYPTDVHHTLGALAGLLEHLPQSLHQLAAGLNAIRPEHLAVFADPPTPTERQAEVAVDLGHAIAAIEGAATHLRRAQQTAAELVYTGPILGI